MITPAYKKIILFWLLLLPVLVFAGTQSSHNAGVSIKSESLTPGTATATVYINDNSASTTFGLMYLASGTPRVIFTKEGAIKPADLTTAQRDAITNASAGLMIFNTDTSKLQVYDGSGWYSAIGTDSTVITATTSLALTGNSPGQGEFYFEAGSNITITPYVGASTTWVFSSTSSGGSVTASPTIQNTDGYLSISDGGNNDFTIEVNETLPGFNANKIQGTSVSNASPTALQLYWYNATSTALVPVTLTAGSNVTISATGENALTISSTGGSGSAASETLFFPHLSPTAAGDGGTVDIEKQTVYVASASFKGVDFGSTIIPTKWDGSTDIPISVYVATPDIPGASAVVLQLRAQYIKAGSAVWNYANYSIIATATVTLASQTTVQVLSPSNFLIPNGSIAEKAQVYVQIFRVGTDGSDTHDDDLHFYQITGDAASD